MQHALVTGASSGIGEAIARALATCGYFVWLVGRDEVRLQGVLDAIGGAEHGAWISADVQTPEGIARIAQTVRQSGRPLGLLVNSAGAFAWDESFPGDTLEEKRANAIAALDPLLFQSKQQLWDALKDLLQASPGGAVVNISSQAANFPDYPTETQPLGAFAPKSEVGYVRGMARVSLWTKKMQTTGSSGVPFILIEPVLTDTPGARREFSPATLDGFDPWADPNNYRPVSSVVEEVLEKLAAVPTA